MMKNFRFFTAYFTLTVGRLRRQLWLLAGLALVCSLLPAGAGRAAEQLLSRGAGVGGITLAITAPLGDNTPEKLAGYMSGMEDIAQYCRVEAMGEEEALDALRTGEVTAVLALPVDFIRGVMYGKNPDLRLIVAGDRPLESLLLLWVGQGGCDILSAAQSGIYAVLDLYREIQPQSPSYDRVLADINLRYMTLTLNRADFFSLRPVSATRELPVALHYGLSLLAYFGLAAAPLFMGLYSGEWLKFQNRLRAAGRSCAAGFFSAVAASVPAWLFLLVPGLLAAGEAAPVPLAASALVMALFCALSSALCCLAAGSAAGCGTLSFSATLAALALAGGIVPPVLLPRVLQELGWLSPVTWLRQLAAWPLGYGVSGRTWACLGLSLAGMAALAFALYRRETERQEAEQCAFY